VDLIIERGDRLLAVEIKLLAVEIKASQTESSEHFSVLDKFSADLHSRRRQELPITKLVVYAGNSSQERSNGHLVSWREIHTYPWL